MNSKSYAIGVDLGGTYVKYALVSSLGEILFSDKMSIGQKAKRDDILLTMEKAITQVLDFADEKALKIAGIGIGTPGIVNDGIVLGGADNLDQWEDINLAKIFRDKFNLKVVVDNDANVMGIAETMFGAAKNCTDVVFITVGTGIGGAVIMNGQLYSGFQSRGGELGHITIQHDGIACNCGGRGCLEAYASTTALIEQYGELTHQNKTEIDGHLIVHRYKEGEEAAVQCMKKHTDYLGHGIAGFINIFSPQKVVIGGGISESGSFYTEMIEKSAMSYAMPDCATNTEVVAASLGNQAGCLGAASLVFL